MSWKNPYTVLGVAPNASDDEVKRAYRSLARKYHPDVYQNSPLSDVAQEKMKKINEAYDTIVRERKEGIFGNSPGYGERQGANSSAYNRSDGTYYQRGYRYSGGSPPADSSYPDIRQLINAGRFQDAEVLLNGVPRDKRNAEWYYLMGIIYQRKGWLEEAFKHFSQAHSMDPGNAEYAQVYRMANMRRNNTNFDGYGRKGSSICRGNSYRNEDDDCEGTCCDALTCCACMNMLDCC